MPRDERTYITVHDGLPDHPKIDGLSDAAFRLLITMWCWCSRNRTDGKVKAASWSKRGTAKARRELIAAGLVVADGEDFAMHDYLEHQRSAQEIEDLSAVRRLAGSKGGKARASAIASAKAFAKQTASKSVAESDTETEEEQEHTSDRESDEPPKSTNDARFAEFWKAYPRHVGKPDALRALGRALKRTDLETILAGARRYAADPNREDAYTAHPATWLNREGWADDPLPPRNGRVVPAPASPPADWMSVTPGVAL